MKSIISKFTDPILYTIATTILVIALACSSTSYADSENPGPGNNVEISTVDHINGFAAHARMIHDQLGITPLQENLWNNVTLIMRENSQSMAALIRSRAKQETAMTALDDLKSYSEVASLHADGLKKFIPAFEALYKSMSEEQQKNADILFQNQRKKMTGN
jgi:hypothetical protein